MKTPVYDSLIELEASEVNASDETEGDRPSHAHASVYAKKSQRKGESRAVSERERPQSAINEG